MRKFLAGLVRQGQVKVKTRVMSVSMAGSLQENYFRMNTYSKLANNTRVNM